MSDEAVATRLASLVRDRRIELGMSQAEVAIAARAAGRQLSPQTVTMIERAQRSDVKLPQREALEVALRLPRGTIGDVIAGKRVTVPANDVTPPEADDLAAIRAEVAALRRELRGDVPETDDEVTTIAGVLRLFSPEQRDIFKRALDVVDAETYDARSAECRPATNSVTCL